MQLAVLLVCNRRFFMFSRQLVLSFLFSRFYSSTITENSLENFNLSS